MDYRKEAEEIRTNLPEQISFTPPPLPLVGSINLLKRHDGGYVIAATGHDDQAGQFNDGSIAAEILDGETVAKEGPDELADALARAHESLLRLRLEAAMRLAVEIGRRIHDDETLVSMFKDALAANHWE